MMGGGVMAGRRLEGNRYVLWVNWVGIDVLTGKAKPSLTFLPRSCKCILSGAGESTPPSLSAWLLGGAVCEGVQGKWKENVTSWYRKRCSETSRALWLPSDFLCWQWLPCPDLGQALMHAFIHSFVRSTVWEPCPRGSLICVGGWAPT